MRLLLLFILLAFPIAEIWLLIDLAETYGWWLALYLVLVTYLGWCLIQEEKQLLAGRMLQTLMQSPSPNLSILGGLKNLLAGDRKSTRLNSSHIPLSRMPSSA